MIFMIKKNHFILISILALTSCNTLTITNSLRVLDGYLFGYESDEVSIERYNSFNTSFARVKFGGGESVYVVLAYAKPGSYEWRSADNISIFTNNGHIFKTIGLERDIEYQSFDVNKSLTESNTNFTFKNPPLYGLSANNSFKEKKLISIKRLEENIELRRITHNLKIDEISFKASNDYYLNEQGVVLLTRQKIHPMYPNITIEFFYK